MLRVGQYNLPSSILPETARDPLVALSQALNGKPASAPLCAVT